MAAPVVWAVLYLVDAPQFLVGWVLEASLLFLSLIVVLPLLEEIVFRGLLQGWLMRQRLGHNATFGITNANIVTSIVFTAMHFIYHTPLMAMAIFVPSLVFGYFRDRYDGWLSPSIVLHCFYNTGYFLIYNPVS